MTDIDTEDRYIETVSGVDPDEYNNNNFFDDAYTDEGSTIETGSYARNVRRELKEIKQADPGYNSVRRRVVGPDEKVRTMRIVFYETSSTPGMFLRNAMTGHRQEPYRTGTYDEDLFYSVCLATGETGRRESSMLFYDNPEQYERHFFTQVPREIKDAWANKARHARERNANTLQRAERLARTSVEVK